MMDDGLADQRAQVGHPIRKPLRNATTVQRKIGRSGFIGHQLNCPGGGPRPPRTALEFTYCSLRIWQGERALSSARQGTSVANRLQSAGVSGTDFAQRYSPQIGKVEQP